MASRSRIKTMNAKPTQIKEALQNYKKIAVIGLSPNEERPSNSVTRYMIRKGYNIIGVNPGHTSILDQPCYSSLAEVPEQVEIVDVFRDSKAVPEIVDQAIQMKVKVLWLQEGVTHAQAEEKAAKAGILVISDLCILKEHRKYIQHNEGTKEKSQAV